MREAKTNSELLGESSDVGTTVTKEWLYRAQNTAKKLNDFVGVLGFNLFIKVFGGLNYSKMAD